MKRLFENGDSMTWQQYHKVKEYSGESIIDRNTKHYNSFSYIEIECVLHILLDHYLYFISTSHISGGKEQRPWQQNASCTCSSIIEDIRWRPRKCSGPLNETQMHYRSTFRILSNTLAITIVSYAGVL